MTILPGPVRQLAFDEIAIGLTAFAGSSSALAMVLMVASDLLMRVARMARNFTNTVF